MSLPLHLLDKEDYTYDFQEYRKRYSWVEDMFNTEQDFIHHSEGNVGIHTNMVLDALIAQEEFKSLNQKDKEILFVGALFHDVEKRSTTIINSENRIESPGHAKKGEVSTRSILYKDFNTDFDVREKICKIVRHHGLPVWVFEKKDPLKSIIESSLISNNFHLYLTAKSDFIGRHCADKEEMLYRVELFKEFANENQIFEKSKSFTDNHSKMIYFEKENSFIDYVPFDDTKFEVVLMSGLPGSGKDYYIQKNFSAPVISLDEIRREFKIKPGDKYGTGFVIQTAKERAREFLRKKEPFVWNGTNITKQIREQVLGLMREYNARTKIVYIEVPYYKLREQNSNREYPIPEKELEKFVNKLEVPQITEATIVEYKVPTYENHSTIRSGYL